ncbi:hypothetical protein V8B55DRAFT_1386343 [Mucor lusitanicus]|uniref:Secreted protein n=2 Tax=Mucor circinelloides f. lusitanicus TaxID=29924 RepID=A0A162T8W7_MUCCL|nr:hypothetical protein FB192DRAFT_1400925 [Mucor lusitanicus]OAD02772.1 hypothetical protein MUCCIDRAFT_80796 [Mucor lusitanicus CBS 277.49]
MKYSTCFILPLFFALSVHASTSSASKQDVADSGNTDQVPPIGFPPVKIPANANDANLPLNVQIDTEGHPINVGAHSNDAAASSSPTPPGLPSPIISAATKIGPCDTANEARCKATKEMGATSCSNSSLGTACATAQGKVCDSDALDACIDFTGANGVYCSAFGCAQYLDE